MILLILLAFLFFLLAIWRQADGEHESFIKDSQSDGFGWLFLLHRVIRLMKNYRKLSFCSFELICYIYFQIWVRRKKSIELFSSLVSWVFGFFLLEILDWFIRMRVFHRLYFESKWFRSFASSRQRTSKEIRC